ncbi:hypothetical protein, partial [Eisenbergiella porci]|uniref:hypothetical protein n=1 Tax=Eisenbergiella porci TaxID=2652274 RepID=UPI002A8140B5
GLLLLIFCFSKRIVAYAASEFFACFVLKHAFIVLLNTSPIHIKEKWEPLIYKRYERDYIRYWSSPVIVQAGLRIHCANRENTWWQCPSPKATFNERMQ